MLSKTVSYRKIALFLTLLGLVILVPGCSILTKELQVNTVCPPFPPGGIPVGEELERIPYNGWPELALLNLKLGADCKAGNQYACQISEIVKPTFEVMKPERGFEHLYGWLGKIMVLKGQLDRCASD